MHASVLAALLELPNDTSASPRPLRPTLRTPKRKQPILLNAVLLAVASKSTLTGNSHVHCHFMQIRTLAKSMFFVHPLWKSFS